MGGCSGANFPVAISYSIQQFFQELFVKLAELLILLFAPIRVDRITVACDNNHGTVRCFRDIGHCPGLSNAKRLAIVLSVKFAQDIIDIAFQISTIGLAPFCYLCFRKDPLAWCPVRMEGTDGIQSAGFNDNCFSHSGQLHSL